MTTKDKIKILFVTNMYPTDGLPAFGIFVQEQISDVTNKFDCEYDVFFINGRQNGKLEYLRSIFSIPAKIKKGCYQIIHIHYGLSALFLLFFRPKCKVFITLHGADILTKQGKNYQVLITKKALKRANKVFILNQEMEEVVQSLAHNYEVLPCGVDTDFFKPDGHRKNDNKSGLILFPSAYTNEVKNYALFEKVIQMLSERVGFKIECAAIDNLSREGVRDLLNKADCILMTSISEGSPQVIKEALSCGLPVVSVPVGDVRYMVQGIPHCYVSKTYTPEELCVLVLKAIEVAVDPDQIRGAFLGKKIYDNFSVSNRLIENYMAN